MPYIEEKAPRINPETKQPLQPDEWVGVTEEVFQGFIEGYPPALAKHVNATISGTFTETDKDGVETTKDRVITVNDFTETIVTEVARHINHTEPREAGQDEYMIRAKFLG